MRLGNSIARSLLERSSLEPGMCMQVAMGGRKMCSQKAAAPNSKPFKHQMSLGGGRRKQSAKQKQVGQRQCTLAERWNDLPAQ